MAKVLYAVDTEQTVLPLGFEPGGLQPGEDLPKVLCVLLLRRAKDEYVI